MKIKGVIEDLRKKKKIKKKITIIKIYPEIALELLQAMWAQFSFR